MADIALGAIPLVALALQSYQQAYAKIKLYREYSSKVRRFHTKLKCQKRVFENEIRLLLQFALDDEGMILAMKSDPKHEKWHDESLNETVKTRLGDDYDAIVAVIQSTKEALEELEEQIKCFDTLRDPQQKDDNAKAAFKRIKGGIKLAFSNSNADAAVEELRNSTTDLERLRKQINKLHKNNGGCAVTAVKAPSPSEWMRLQKTRQASKALHDALVEAWTCAKDEHTGHAVKLFVETSRVNDDVRVNMALVCRSHDRNIRQSSLVQLEVHSRVLEWREISKLPGRMPPAADQTDQRPKKRLKIVRFSETTITSTYSAKSCNTSPTKELDQACIQASLDLRASKDFCRELSKTCPSTTSCLGHLDNKSEEAFRHLFYPDLHQRACPSTGDNSIDPVTLEKVLNPAAADFVTMVDRLKLAKAIVSAVLKFHSTPWLAQLWQLQDLAFFPNDDQDLSKSLTSLHVETEFSREHCSRMEGIQETYSDRSLSQLSDDEKDLFGIGDMTLHSLGVALLQIDRWKRVDLNQAEHLLQIRKMAKERFLLGPRYRDITNKCLRCDFGRGNQLSEPALQKAVYEDVVGSLERMISILEINE